MKTKRTNKSLKTKRVIALMRTLNYLMPQAEDSWELWKRAERPDLLQDHILLQLKVLEGWVRELNGKN